jgi:hypothetical protein
MRRLLKHLLVGTGLMVAGGCSGASGCSSCGGLTPLPGGFPIDKRIENAGSARITESGVAFLEANLGAIAGPLVGGGAGGLSFPVPASGGQFLGFINYEICPGGPDPNANPPTCLAEIDLANAVMDLQPTAPHNLVIQGDIPLRIQDLPFDSTLGGMTITLNNNNACPGDAQEFAPIGVSINLSIEADPDMSHARYGYSRIKVSSVSINEDDISDAIKLNCDGFLGQIADLLKGVLIGQLLGGLSDTLVSSIEDQLCQKANPELSPSCPTGTTDVEGTCRYGSTADAECVSIMLGLDGNLNLGEFLSGISPGTKGGLDILFAAGGHNSAGNGLVWGDVNPVNNGLTLGLYGGSEPTPISECVQQAVMPLPTGVPIPDELLENSVSGWPAGVDGPHVGIGLSERFFNYALGNAYNSGLLCLGLAIDNPLLSSGTFGLLAPSLSDLGLQRESQSLALVVRPGAPPTVAFGDGTNLQTDPSVRILMPQASVDFYIWSLDRFIRFMTVTVDLDVPMNLTVTPEGLVPVLQDVGVNNATVTNSALLSEDPATLAAAISDLVAGQVGSALGGGISPIDLNGMLSSLGLQLVIPETVDGQGSPGLRKLTKGSDNYLGIFAGFGLAAPSMSLQPVGETQAAVLDKKIDRAGLVLSTITKENMPVVKLGVSSTLEDLGPVAYSYRVDNGFWSPLTSATELTVKSPLLRTQGRHVIQVRSRLVDDAYSLDPTPAEVEVLVDAEAPTLKVREQEGGGVSISMDDLVSKGAGKIRYKLDDGEFGPWIDVREATQLDAALVGDAHEITVEAKDEEGNVAQAKQAIRGKGDAAGDCGCRMVGARDELPTSAWLAGLGALGAVLLRRGQTARRRRRSAQGEGAELDGRDALGEGDEGAASGDVVAPPARSKRRRSSLGSFGAVLALGVAASFAGCNCGPDTGTPGTGGSSYSCEPPNCAPLEYGLIGSYSSVAVSGSDVWVSGYAEADWDHNFTWGDLVVGKWDGEKVDWVAVDGVPTEPAPNHDYFDRDGFRGGQTSGGDDVGLWTSIALDPSGNPGVAYYDRTRTALKFAHFDGTAWTTETVEQAVGADLGRYAKLVYDGASPIIAYQAIEPTDGGAVRSAVRIARGLGGGGWSFEDVAVDELTPCRKKFCPTGTECFADTLTCQTPSDGCAESCGSGTECIDLGQGPTCAAVFGGTKLDTYPDAIGLYISLAQGPGGELGLAYYDRIRGHLYVARQEGGAWVSQVVDGVGPDGNDTNDVGIGASLTIDGAGDWHLSYLDGIDEALKYLVVSGGTTPGTPELVDTGFAVEGVAFTDGQHIVGDDSNIVVTQGGEVRISYQDASAGTLRYAIGTPSGEGHTWQLRVLAQDGFAGAFSRQVEVDGELVVTSFWRTGGAGNVRGDVRFMTP